MSGRNAERAVMHTWTAQDAWNGPTIVGGSGAVFWDVSGKRYIDMSSMAECSNLGHQHPAVVAAIKEQADKMCFVTSAWGAEPRAELATKLLEVSGFAGGRVFFAPGGGADANEKAVLMALWASGKSNGKIITRYRSYHGATIATMELSGDDRGADYPPCGLRVIRALPPYCYRCPFNERYPSCNVVCADTIGEMIEREGPSQVAAVLMEPAAGTNGIAAPPEYWPRLREITKRHGVLLIADEVMSGFGRVGEWFAWQKYGEKGRPDIMTIAKGLTGAHLPLGAVVVSEKVALYFKERKFMTGATYSGHPLACAAGVAAINAYRSENLIARSRTVGEAMHKALATLATHHSSIGDIRGEGLFAILELIKNRRTREALAPWPEIAPSLKTLVAEGRKRGVSFAARGNLVILAPPLVIRDDELFGAIAVLDRLLRLCDAETTA